MQSTKHVLLLVFNEERKKNLQGTVGPKIWQSSVVVVQCEAL